MSNTMNITDEQIEQLRREAAMAGDASMAAACDRALDGDDVARAECAEAIADARSRFED
jgi:hypothetical protein